jgi:hypothetical protein
MGRGKRIRTPGLLLLDEGLHGQCDGVQGEQGLDVPFVLEPAAYANPSGEGYDGVSLRRRTPS